MPTTLKQTLPTVPSRIAEFSGVAGFRSPLSEHAVLTGSLPQCPSCITPFAQPEATRSRLPSVLGSPFGTERSPSHIGQFDGIYHRQEDFFYDDYLDFGDDFPEEVKLPCGTTPQEFDMVAAFQEHIKDMGLDEDRATTVMLIRDAIPVRGVKMLQVRVELHKWYNKWIETHGAVPVATQKEFALLLIASEWYEDKLASVLFMQEVLIAGKCISHLDMPRFEAIFRANHIRVYKVCDHFAEKVLVHLVRHGARDNGELDLVTDILFAWTRADDVWQARAGLAALCVHANSVLMHDRLLDAVQIMLARPEEDAKSAAGTALRAISDADALLVINFLNRREIIANISVNALQKATSRLTKAKKEHFRALRRNVVAKNYR